MKIMFICTGNICRSAMAEAMLKKMLQEQNRNDIEVYSCGTFADNGDTCTQNAIITMQQYNIDLSNHKATNIHFSKIKEMDLILCATNSHKYTVIQMYPNLQEKVYTLKEYIGSIGNIADPWGYDIETYQKCAKEIRDCLEKIVIEK